MARLSIFCVIIVVTFVTAQINSPGPCPSVKFETDIAIEKYFGTWYENQKFPMKREMRLRCMKSEYHMLANGTVAIVTTGINDVNRHPIKSYALALSAGSPGIFNLKFLPNKSRDDKLNYVILGTDYDNFSVAYACKENPNGTLHHDEYTWIYTRALYPSPIVLDQAKNILNENGIDADFLMPSVQLGCYDE